MLRAVLATALLATVLAVGTSIVEDPPTAGAARTWHVAPWGDDAADGSSAAPLRTVKRGVRAARSGDRVVLRGGTYRESVQIRGKAVHISSYGSERAVLDGAVEVENWHASGGAWYSDGWTQQFYREPPGGPVSERNITAGYPDQVFVDGQPLRQVLRHADLTPGAFWHETDADRLWVGENPAGRRVEASTLRFGVYFNEAHGSSLTNVTVRRYATERRDMAAVRAYGNDIVLQGVHAELNARIGISAIGRKIVIRDTRIIDNGFLGLHADRVDTLVVERAAVRGNNQVGFDAWHSAGGVKITSSSGVTIRDSDVSYNDGPGIWTDLDTRFVTLVRNFVSNNGRSGIEIELSRNTNILSNVVLGNGEAGIWILESQDVQVLHNASLSNLNAIEVEEGPRRDVRNVMVRNNIVGRAAGGSQALLVVNDWTAQRSAKDMRVVADYNAFWLPADSGTINLSKWGRWPRQVAFAGDLDAHRVNTGQEHNSVLSTDDANPFVRDPGALDYRGPDSLRRGAALTGSAAAELGVSSGTRLRIGPVGPVRER